MVSALNAVDEEIGRMMLLRVGPELNRSSDCGVQPGRTGQTPDCTVHLEEATVQVQSLRMETLYYR